jgi:hypothetical protein
MIINSNEYFNKKIKWNKVYKIVVVKNNKDIEEMISYFLDFIKLNSIKKSVGLDFEFNSSPEGKKIALFQINLESDKNDAKIYLFYPPDLKDTQLKILINLLTNPNVKKILHIYSKIYLLMMIYEINFVIIYLILDICVSIFI